MGRVRKKHVRLVPHPLNRIKRKNQKEVRRIVKIIGNGSKVVFDIGAFIGTYSLSFANRLIRLRNDNAKIYAFEPIKSNYEILLRNIKLNGFGKWIKPFNFGFYDKEGEVCMGVPSRRRSENNDGLYTVDTGEEPLSKMLNCNVMRLKDFVEKHDIGNIDIIKIDAEGSELNILKDSIEILPCVKFLHIEINKEFESSKKIASFLKDTGFSYAKNTHDINEVWKNNKHRRLHKND